MGLLELSRRSVWSRYFLALGGLGLSTALLWGLPPYLDLTLTNLVMIYLLLVVIAASGWAGGRLSWCRCSASPPWLIFVSLYFSFAVQNTEYAIDLAVMFTVSILISELTGRIRHQAQMARLQERQTAVLYEMSRTLPAILSLQDLLQTVLAQVATIFASRVSVLMPDPGGNCSSGPGSRLKMNMAGKSWWGGGFFVTAIWPDWGPKPCPRPGDFTCP